jgi:hypothetical protein
MVWSVCGEQGNETESENGETHDARYPSSNRARRPLASSHREEWRVLLRGAMLLKHVHIETRFIYENDRSAFLLGFF